MVMVIKNESLTKKNVKKNQNPNDDFSHDHFELYNFILAQKLTILEGSLVKKFDKKIRQTNCQKYRQNTSSNKKSKKGEQDPQILAPDE